MSRFATTICHYIRTSDLKQKQFTEALEYALGDALYLGESDMSTGSSSLASVFSYKIERT